MTGQLATRVMKARRPGECPRCGRYISVGQQIGSCGGLWFCIRCIVGHCGNQYTVLSSPGGNSTRESVGYKLSARSQHLEHEHPETQ